MRITLLTVVLLRLSRLLLLQFGAFGNDGNPFGVNFNLGQFPQR